MCLSEGGSMCGFTVGAENSEIPTSSDILRMEPQTLLILLHTCTFRDQHLVNTLHICILYIIHLKSNTKCNIPIVQPYLTTLPYMKRNP